MCVLYAHDIINSMCYDYAISRGGIQLTNYSTTIALKSLGVTINFIDTWLKKLDKEYVWHFQAYNNIFRVSHRY